MSISTQTGDRVLRDVHDEVAQALRTNGEAVIVGAGGAQVTTTNVAGKESLDVNVTALTLTAEDDKIETRSIPMKTALDEASATVTYVGEAATGTATGSASWRIKRLTQSGTVLLIEWADGNGNFDNIWNNRALLSYS